MVQFGSVICKSTHGDESVQPMLNKTATSSVITRLAAMRDTRSFLVMNTHHDQLGAHRDKAATLQGHGDHLETRRLL